MATADNNETLTIEDFAIQYIKCPRCGAHPHNRCSTPSKTEMKRPHLQRRKPVLAMVTYGVEMIDDDDSC